MDEKPFINSKAKRFLSFGKTVLKVGGEYALLKGKNKAKELVENVNEARQKQHQTIIQIKAAKELIKTMATMKGAAMKLGQMLSITEDLVLPLEVTELFKVLQKETSYMPKDQVDEVFKNNFNKSPSELFKSFDYVAIAAASIGQVHKAELESGEVVAVKIQYPNIEEVIKNDLKNIDHLKSLIQTIIPGHPKMDPLIEELKRSLIEECDYIQEKKSMDEFREMLKDEFPNIIIPRAFNDFCTKQVLTMDFLEGSTFDETLKWSAEDRNIIGQLYYQFYIFTVFHKRYFHSDPQHGNFLFNKGSMILLDFGSTKKLDLDFMNKYISSIKSVFKDDYEQFQFHMIDFGVFNENISDERLKEFYGLLRKYVMPYASEGSFPIENVNPLKSFFDFAINIPFKHRGVPDKNFVLLDRTNVGMYMKLKKWRADIDWSSSRQKYLFKIAQDE